MLSGCTTSSNQTEVIPTDGVHITGAISAVYPITNGGTCPYVVGLTGKELEFSAKPGAGQAYFGGVVARFTGPATYTDVQWPPNGHSSLYVALGARSWRAESGLISVKAFGNGSASGTLWASGLREVNGSTTVNAAGSWICRILLPPPAPSPSPEPSPTAYPTLPPPPVGTPVRRQVLPPATVLPVVDLCSSPVQVFQNGNAGPLSCEGGALDVLTWKFFVDNLNPKVMSLGPTATLTEIQAALCADLGQHITLPQEDSAFFLAAAYYGWQRPTGPAHGFDPSAWVIGGGCR